MFYNFLLPHACIAGYGTPFFLHSPVNAGDGKTHYIKEQLATSPAQLTIAVNEAFTPLKAISKLRSLPINQGRASIFFNFTMLPPGVRQLLAHLCTKKKECGK